MDTTNCVEYDLESILLGAEPFIQYLYETDRVSGELLLEALEKRKAQKPKFGQIALERRLLTVRQLFTVLGDQADSHEPFGQVAIRLGYLTSQHVSELLQEQQRRSPTLVEVLMALDAFSSDELSCFKREFSCGSQPAAKLNKSSHAANKAAKPRVKSKKLYS